LKPFCFRVRGRVDLLERIERRGDFFFRRSFAVISLDLFPANTSALIEHKDGRMRNAIELIAGIGRIAHAVAIDDRRARIGEQRKTDGAAAVRRDSTGEIATLFRQILADRVNANGRERAPEGAKSGYW